MLSKALVSIIKLYRLILHGSCCSSSWFLSQFVIQLKIDLKKCQANSRSCPVPSLQVLGPCKLRQGTLTKYQSSRALGWGDQKQWPFFLFYLQGAITHKHLFLKLFYICIFFDHGKWYQTTRILYI